MAKYKMCPECGAKSSPQEMECLRCEADLQGVPIMDEEAVCEPSELEPQEDAEAAPARVCECGAANPVRNRRCLTCGADISFITPIVPPGDPKTVFEISLVGTSFSRALEHGLSIIGREGDFAGALSSKRFVSRKHAELSLDADSLSIRDLGSTNGTFVNNSLLEKDEVRELSDGDEVGLGGNAVDGERQGDAAYFFVKVAPCS